MGIEPKKVSKHTEKINSFTLSTEPKHSACSKFYYTFLGDSVTIRPILTREQSYLWIVKKYPFCDCSFHFSLYLSARSLSNFLYPDGHSLSPFDYGSSAFTVLPQYSQQSHGLFPALSRTIRTFVDLKSFQSAV